MALHEDPLGALDRAAPLARFPVTLSASDARIAGRAPELGEHTDEILAALGVPADGIAALRARDAC